MKIYSIVENLNTPSDSRIWVPQNSQYKIAIKAVQNGEDVALSAVKLFDGNTEISADGDAYAGYKTFTRNSTSADSKELTVKVLGQDSKLFEVVTDSTVFEVGGEGGEMVIPAPVAIYDNEDEEQATKKLDVDGKMYEKSSSVQNSYFYSETKFPNNIPMISQTDDVTTWKASSYTYTYTKSTGVFTGQLTLGGKHFEINVTPGLDVNDGGDYSQILVPVEGQGGLSEYRFVKAEYTEGWSETNSVLKSDNPTMLLSGTYEDDTTFEISAYVKQ